MFPLRMRITHRQAVSAARHARRLLERQRQEGAVGQPQRERPRQRERQPGFPFLPELFALPVVDAARSMDQITRPVRCGGCRSDKPQGARGVARFGRGCLESTAPRVAAVVVPTRRPS